MSKGISQRSLRIGLAAIALVLISSFAIATTWSNSFEWLGFVRASAENTTATVKETTAPTVPLIIGTCDVATAALPIEVESIAPVTGPTAYATLKLAFDAINAGTHTGTINVEVCFNSVEGTTPATLNSTGAGAAVYTSISIRPLVDGVSFRRAARFRCGAAQLSPG